MKNFKILSITAVFALLLVAMQGCSFSTANMSGLTTSKDKDGKEATTSFKGGDTIYAKAPIANNPGKVKVKFSLTDPSGKAVSGADVSVDIEGDGFASYSLPTSGTMAAGSYKLTADMLNESGEKKDSKTATLTMAAGAPPPTAPSDAPASSDDEDK